MKKLSSSFIGILLIASFAETSSTKNIRVKRYNGWNWNGQDNSGQASQNSWPSSKGDVDGASKRRPDSKTNRDGRWTNDWGSADIQTKEDMPWGVQPAQGNSKGSAYPEEEGNLEVLLRGSPGTDFPNFSTIPDTSFDCAQMPSQGYYGDVEAGCQVFHICQPGNRKDSFLCPVGTVFNQKVFVCDWWFNYNCSETTAYYGRNEEIYREVTTRAPKGDEATTEKMLPWSAQDLDKKRPTTKSWAPSVPKQPQAEVATKRGGKSSTSSVVSTHQRWSHTDFQQKEVAVAWSHSSTAKPRLWYGIDGRPSMDQSDGSSATWLASSQGLATWTPTGSPKRATTFQGSGNTRDWLNRGNLPETSIIPTDVKGVWAQETTKQAAASSHVQGVVTKSRFSADSAAWGARIPSREGGLKGEASELRTKKRRVVGMKVVPKHKRWY